jgi:hypothetical protein
MIDVVLVKAPHHSLGLDLHQLSKRVLQPTGDGDSTAQGNIQVGQLLTLLTAKSG